MSEVEKIVINKRLEIASPLWLTKSEIICFLINTFVFC